MRTCVLIHTPAHGKARFYPIQRLEIETTLAQLHLLEGP